MKAGAGPFGERRKGGSRRRGRPRAQSRERLLAVHEEDGVHELPPRFEGEHAAPARGGEGVAGLVHDGDRQMPELSLSELPSTRR
jgi:hypothetical protein